MRWLIPDPLPTGTLKLKLISLANASTGNLIVDPQWVAVALNADPSAATLVAEGNTTISFTAVDDYKETEITLDATTAPTAGQMLVMSLVFKDTPPRLRSSRPLCLHSVGIAINATDTTKRNEVVKRSVISFTARGMRRLIGMLPTYARRWIRLMIRLTFRHRH